MEKIPVTDARTELEILEEMGKKAVFYTPEWRFDQAAPDIGTALASVYANMHYGTISQYNQIASKFKTEFFRMLQASMKPSAPAAGYATFSLVNDQVEGIELPKGTALTCGITDDDGEMIPLETLDDLYVSPVKLEAVYESFDGEDYIGKLFEADPQASETVVTGFHLFTRETGNLQIHEFYLGHPYALLMKSSGKLELTLYEREGLLVKERLLKRLLESNTAVFEYSVDQGWETFDKAYVENSRLCFEKQAEKKPWHSCLVGEEELCWLRCRILDFGKVKELSFQEAYLATQGSLLAPDSINANGMDSGRDQYFPFGEQFSVYNEVYLESDEALSKPGSLVQLSFQREFIKIPLADLDWGLEIDWKLIMPKSAIKVEKEYDISIAEVIWEYFNGSGWVKLFPGKEYSGVFGLDEGTHRQKVVLVFQCPKDSGPVMVNGREGYYVRARILKVNNAFKTQGQYISPVLRQTYFQYQYMEDGVQPTHLVVSNNLVTRCFRAEECLKQPYVFSPVFPAGDKVPTLYLGMEQPFQEGPLRMLWMVENGNMDKRPPLQWEYYGNGRWRNLNPADETEYFRKTGLITFTGPDDAVRTEIFGQHLYWIRIRDQENVYQNSRPEDCPVISSVHMNAVHIWTVRSGFEEYMTLEKYEDNPQFWLLYRGIHDIRVWVNETGVITDAQKKVLEQEGRLSCIYDGDGVAAETWVLWKETESFSQEDRNSRCYRIDANEGRLSFGGGRHGRLPSPGVLNGIHVVYSIGGGSVGNLEEGQVNGLNLSAGFINQVGNPLPLSGGYDRENATNAMERTAGGLRHKFRAVTTQDYEMLALEASGNIGRAACFGGLKKDGRPAPGHVTLVLLQRDYENEMIYFSQLQEKVLKYLEDKVPAGLLARGQFHIIPPVMVEVRVSAQVWVVDFNQIFQCRTAILENLDRFLNPITGNFDGKGWEVGTLPGRSQLESLLKHISEVEDIRNLIITGVIRNGSIKTEVRLEDMEQCPYVLPEAGRHRITVHVE